MKLSNDINEKSMSNTQLGQLSLLDNNQEIRKEFRPIHYLGSKLRMVEFIKNTIDQLDPDNSPICDLFAGSGTVSHYLATSRVVTSVDIQEYSRVICSALLKKVYPVYKGEEIVKKCVESDNYKLLHRIFLPLIKYESECFLNKKHPELACELVEHGSIYKFEYENDRKISNGLLQALTLVSEKVIEFNLRTSPKIVTTRYYGGIYFSYMQAVQIDGLLEVIFNLENEEKELYLAALLSTVSDIVNTIGKQFAQPIKTIDSKGNPKKNIIDRLVKDREINVFDRFQEWVQRYVDANNSKHNNTVLCMDYADALDCINKDIKIVYADPPYTRYHYSRYYHVLETICKRDNPKISMVKVNGKEKLSRGIYRVDRYQSPFSIKTQAYEAFEHMIKKISSIGAILILSYSPYEANKNVTPRLQTIQGIIDLASKYYMDVQVVSPGTFMHSKLNSSDKLLEASSEAEVLIICKDIRG